MSTRLASVARTAVKAKLSDPTTGVNAGLVDACGDLGIPLFQFDLGSSSQQFFFGQVTAEQLEDSSAIKYPLLTIYLIKARNRNYQKFNEFSGDLLVGADVWLSWPKGAVLPDFESYSDAVEESVITAMNTESAQDWTPPLAYNGGVTSTRGPVLFGAQSWVQRIQFVFEYQAHSG